MMTKTMKMISMAILVTASSAFAQKQNFTVAELKAMNQNQLDKLYASLGSGPIPTGDFVGSVVSKKPSVLAIESKVVQGIRNHGIWGFMAKLSAAGICGSTDRVECLAEMLWSGKRFYPANEDGEIQLRNAVSMIFKSKTLSLGLKYFGLGEISEGIKSIPLEKFDSNAGFIRRHTGLDQKMMMFPAHVYCGQSLLDARRESIVIDYAYGDDFKPFVPQLDSLVGREGMWIRDEIRMLRPGVYLGRAYLDRIFLLNFVLEASNSAKTSSPTGDGAWKNKCWAGSSWQ